ncbi:hypothetical protein ACWATR_36845 [Nostoc sp. UIC 10890]
MADLDDDEKWLARTYFPMLIAELESLPDHLLESMAEVAQVFGTRAMNRFSHLLPRCSRMIQSHQYLCALLNLLLCQNI